MDGFKLIGGWKSFLNLLNGVGGGGHNKQGVRISKYPLILVTNEKRQILNIDAQS